MAITLKQMRQNWRNLNDNILEVELSTDDQCKLASALMIQRDWSFIDYQTKVFRAQGTDWGKDDGQTKAIENGSKDASSYKLFVASMGRRYEKVEVGKDESGRKIVKLKVAADGESPVAKKDKGHSFADPLLKRAKDTHGITLKQLMADDKCNNNVDLAVKLERLDTQKAIQLNFDKIRPELVKAKHAGRTFEADDVVDIVTRLLGTTNIHVDVHNDAQPVTTRVTRVVQDVEDEGELDSTLTPEQMKMFKAMMKMVANG